MVIALNDRTNFQNQTFIRFKDYVITTFITSRFGFTIKIQVDMLDFGGWGFEWSNRIVKGI